MSRPKSPKYGRPMASRPMGGGSSPRSGQDPITAMRTSAYKLGKVLGDVSAVKKGTVGQRVLRRAVGKFSSQGITKFF
jgi:hypothetical protein